MAVSSPADTLLKALHYKSPDRAAPIPPGSDASDGKSAPPSGLKHWTPRRRESLERLRSAPLGQWRRDGRLRTPPAANRSCRRHPPTTGADPWRPLHRQTPPFTSAGVNPILIPDSDGMWPRAGADVPALSRDPAGVRPICSASPSLCCKESLRQPGSLRGWYRLGQ